jgi:arylsulfatase A-like enzyme
MLVTGRLPQTTGHIINSTRTRHSEISIGDTFAHWGYRTAWVGKWHLHTGVWPAIENMPQHPDWVPEGRDRLGFQYWRAYNQHMVYFDGFVHGDDWTYERWEGYETEGLLKYGIDFMDSVQDDPFLLFLSPHQPHFTPFEFAPKKYYELLPETLELPANVPPEWLDASLEMYRHYLAMILAIDDMVGDLMAYLDKTGKADNTIFIFSSDHGSQNGAHGIRPWQKKNPHEESIHVPTIIRYPGVLEAGGSRDMLMGIADFFPTLCSLCDLPVPRSIEGVDLSAALLAIPDAPEQDALLLMNFSDKFDWFADGAEWRGVRTKTHTYARWLSGKVELYDNISDPLQLHNLVESPENQELCAAMEATMQSLMARHNDELVPCTEWKPWLDNQRRVIRNAFGPLSHPESEPDWSLLY